MAKTKEVSSDKLTANNFTIKGSQLQENSGRVFPTTLSLDIALGGGISEGSYVLLSGAPKTGKSTIALHFASNCHQLDKDKKVFFVDCEHRMRPELLNCIRGLDLDRLEIIRSNKNRILTAEDNLNLICDIIKDNDKPLVILDSIAALIPENEISGVIGDSKKMASLASLMYAAYRKISPILSVSQATFIGISHLVSNPGPGKSSYEAGGNAIKYMTSCWLRFTWAEKIEKAGVKIGQMIHGTVLHTALGAPGSDISIPIRYGQGIDEEQDLFNMAVDVGLIERAGAWYTLYDEKYQGGEKVVDFLKENKGVKNKLELEIRNMCIPNHESYLYKK